MPSHIFADRKRRRYFRLFRETRDIRNSSKAGSTISTCTVQNNDEFKQSVILLNKIRELSNPPGSENQIAFQLSKETEGKIITNSREGIRLGKLVSDEYLDSISPELRFMFRNKLIEGSKIFYDGFVTSMKDRAACILSEGEQEQIQGAQLQIEWIEWFDKKAKSSSYKIFED